MCRAGSYNPNAGANGATACIACVAGKYNPTPGSANAGACADCPTGQYTPVKASFEHLIGTLGDRTNADPSSSSGDQFGKRVYGVPIGSGATVANAEAACVALGLDLVTYSTGFPEPEPELEPEPEPEPGQMPEEGVPPARSQP